MRRIISVLLLIVLVGLGVIYYNRMRATGNKSVLGQSTSQGQTITITATDYTFTPNTLTINKGQPVTIELVNNGKMPHDIVSPELNLQSSTIQPGQTTRVTFTPEDSGTFNFYCSVDGHRDLGMVGSIVVQ
jgi:uncharacterized cupredoxin-like copper-binding protein